MNHKTKELSIKQVIDLIGGEWLAGNNSDSNLNLSAEKISNLAPLSSATSKSLCFYSNPKLKKDFLATQAKVVIVQKKMDHSVHQIIHPNPYWAFAKVAQLIYPHPENKSGIHPRAIISESASVSKDGVQIDANVVVEAGAKIASGVRLIVEFILVKTLK